MQKSEKAKYENRMSEKKQIGFTIKLDFESWISLIDALAHELGLSHSIEDDSIMHPLTYGVINKLGTDPIVAVNDTL